MNCEACGGRHGPEDPCPTVPARLDEATQVAVPIDVPIPRASPDVPDSRTGVVVPGDATTLQVAESGTATPHGSAALAEGRTRATDTATPRLPDPPRPQGLAAGESFGPYEIVRELGRGGMGAVYLARDRNLGREVALKVILAGSAAGADDLSRFRREAAAVAALSHPGIVRLYEYGTVEGRPYLAMEYVKGRSLHQVLDDERIDPDRALRIVRETALAVEYAHRNSILHRDLKPANILIDDQGSPHITDFGLARNLAADTRLTQSGEVLGTPAYMSPEQADDILNVDRRADVYSLGAVLYELLTLYPPHRGRTFLELLHRVVNRDPIPPRDIVPLLPRDIETICLKALAREPDRRYASARELADDIDRYRTRRPILARPPSLAYRALRFAQRHPVLVGAASVLLGVVLPGILHLVTRPGHVVVRTTGNGVALRPARVLVGPRSLDIVDDGAIGPVPSGLYPVRVEAPGFEALETVLQVRAGATHDVALALRRETGFFELEVEPRGGSVFIDGIDYGSRLHRVSVDTGEHAILVRKENHHDARFTWTARTDQITRGFVTLPQAVRWSDTATGDKAYVQWIGDADGDGAPDLVARHHSRITAVNPWRKEELWSINLSSKAACPSRHVDFDGDGVLDLVAFLGEHQEVRVSAWSGRKPETGSQPRLLWEVMRPPEGAGKPVPPIARPILADLDGDGTPDILAASLWEHVVTAFSGKDGAVLWNARPGDWCAGLELGDGVKPGEQRLFVATPRAIHGLDARTGDIRWSHPLPAGGPRGFDPDLGRELLYGALRQQAWLAAVPLDDEPGADLLIPCWRGEEGGGFRLHARAGADGRPLWDGPGLRTLDDWSESAVEDVDQDGAADLLALEFPPESNEPTGTLLVDGRTGRPRWRADTVAPCRILRPTGLPPIVCETREFELRCRSAADDRPGRSFPLPGPLDAAPVVMDWDGDGDPDLVAADRDGGLQAFDLQSSDLRSCLLDARIERLIPTGDADGDGFEDLLAMTEQGPVLLEPPRVLWSRHSATRLEGAPLIAPFPPASRPVLGLFGDLGSRAEGYHLIDAATGSGVAWVAAVGDRHHASAPAKNGTVDHLLLIAAGNESTLIRVSGQDGTARRIRSVPQTLSPPACGVLDRQGSVVIVLATWDGPGGSRVLALDADTGTERWHFLSGTASGVSPTLADLCGDDEPEVITVFHDGRIVVLRGSDGSPVWTRKLGDAPYKNPPAVGDLDGDGTKEVLVSSAGEQRDLLCLAGATGKTIWTLSRAGGTTSPILRDVNGDGRPEILVAPQVGGVACFDVRGRLLWQQAMPARPGGTYIVGQTPILDDLDSDGALELLVLIGDRTLSVLDAATGAVRWTLRLRSATISGGLATVDVDGDGRKELVVSGDDRTVYCLRVPRGLGN